jgi:hypothetical protein
MEGWPLRLSLVTLGIANLDRSAAFYAALGLSRSEKASNASVVFFEAGAAVLALFGRSELAADAKVEEAGSGFRGIALAWNVARRRPSRLPWLALPRPEARS